MIEFVDFTNEKQLTDKTWLAARKKMAEDWSRLLTMLKSGIELCEKPGPLAMHAYHLRLVLLAALQELPEN